MKLQLNSNGTYTRNIDGRDEEMIELSDGGLSVKVALLSGRVTLAEIDKLRKQAQRDG